mmetsp:Transcript_27662/g.82987  ORF Transcript_27662/g.82987 Transcript_27662/m.82987 type:complete len:126 (-) Transcript_27662:30-407(-)
MAGRLLPKLGVLTAYYVCACVFWGLGISEAIPAVAHATEAEDAWERVAAASDDNVDSSSARAKYIDRILDTDQEAAGWLDVYHGSRLATAIAAALIIVTHAYGLCAHVYGLWRGSVHSTPRIKLD